jgi:hypothetical protein
MKLLPDRKREAAIEKWMLAVINDGGARRFDDLHIDKIDSTWSARDRWIDGGLEALRIALEVRDRSGLRFTVALAFSLESEDRPSGVDFQTRTDLQARLNWSPPSLYLFHQGEEPRSQIAPGDAVRDLSPSILGTPDGSVGCYYLEYKQRDTDERYRTVFIEG